MTRASPLGLSLGPCLIMRLDPEGWSVGDGNFFSE